MEGSESSGNDSEVDDSEEDDLKQNLELEIQQNPASHGKRDAYTPISHNSSQFLAWAVASEGTRVLAGVLGCLGVRRRRVFGCFGGFTGSCRGAWVIDGVLRCVRGGRVLECLEGLLGGMQAQNTWHF